ncbi:MAG TPA: hypothetical protein VH583_09620 [Vicinamibacterales bacterium]|jgi:hypothetical protein
MASRSACAIAYAAIAVLVTAATAAGQVKAELPPNITPPWQNGIQAINRDNYWNAIACGKQGGQRPLCVFYDAVICPNADFTIAMFTPYKMVAYEVWRTVRQGQPAPQPSYGEAQRTRITVKLTPKKGANPVTGLAIKRGGQTLKPVSQSIDEGVGNFIFDFATFAPTDAITMDMIGKTHTVSCSIDKPALAAMR